MATITINIPTDKETYVLDGFSRAHNYNPDTGETKAQFIKAKLIEILKNDSVQGWIEVEIDRINIDKETINLS